MNQNMQFFIVLILFVLHPIPANYTAAVVEYHAANYTSAKQTIQENLDNFLNYIKKAAENEADIVVFPEYGLTGLVIYPKNYAIFVPDLGTTDFLNNIILQKISSTAKANKIYVVINVLESVESIHGTLYYNSNLVFAKNGTLVAKYRKVGLFYEPELTKGDKSVVFETEFGTFGILTCMDILYYQPSQEIFAKNSKVTDVILSTAWNSILPFYMSIEVQLGYAKANKINLLASNYAIPSAARGGSGIYSKDGTILNMHLSGLNSSKLILARISSEKVKPNNVINKYNMSSYATYRDFNFSVYAYKSLDLSKASIAERLCYKTFCCDFFISTKHGEVNTSEIYKLAVYNGSTLFESTPVNMRFCSIISCTSNDTSTCGLQQTYSTKFQRIAINGTFENKNDHFYRPVTLKGDLIPFLNLNFEETRTGIEINVFISSAKGKSEKNLILFGLYGRGNN